MHMMPCVSHTWTNNPLACESPLNTELNSQNTQSQHSQPAVETVTIKLKSVDGNVISFKVKKTTKVIKIKETYSNQKGVDAQAIRLTFDGDRLSDHQTVDELGLEEGDVIDVSAEEVCYRKKPRRLRCPN